MAYYRVCPHCGATLDASEVCDCLDELQRADYIDEPIGMEDAPPLAVCKGCRSKRYCTALCARAEDEIAERRATDASRD